MPVRLQMSRASLSLALIESGLKWDTLQPLVRRCWDDLKTRFFRIVNSDTLQPSGHVIMNSGQYLPHTPAILVPTFPNSSSFGSGGPPPPPSGGPPGLKVKKVGN
jgi:hypothetical protein